MSLTAWPPVAPDAASPSDEDPGAGAPAARTSWRRVALWSGLGIVLLVGIVLAVAIGPFANAAGSCGGG